MTSRYLELAPSNKSTDNKYAFKNGFAALNFDIPEGNFVLDPSSVRIVGDLVCFKDSAETALVNGDTLALNQKLGVLGLFNQLIWRSSKHQTIISHERNYNRWCSSYLSNSQSVEDSLSWGSQTHLSLPNAELQKRTTMTGDTLKSFCTHLPCGLLNAGQSIPLTSNTLGGLSLSIMLESDAQGLQVLPNYAPNTDPNIAAFLGSFYQLQNVRLICSVITPPPDQLSQLLRQTQGALTYQSVHSYYDTSNSNNMQVSMNFGLSKVKSLFVSMIPSDKLNSLAADGFATLMPCNATGIPADIQKISFLRGGTIFPKLFPRDTNYKENTTTIVPDPVIANDYLNSVSNILTNRNTMGGLINNNRKWISKATGLFGVPYQLVANGGVWWGIGVNYTNFLGGTGINLNKEQWGLNIECALTDSNAQSLFMFVNAQTQIIWTQSGVQILQ